jgi:hypothetical protein
MYNWTWLSNCLLFSKNWRTIPDLFHHLFPFSLNHLPSRKSARLFFFFFIRVFVVVMSWPPVTTRHQFRTFVHIVSHSFQDRVFVFSSSGGTLMTRVKFLSKESCSQFSLQLIFVGKKARKKDYLLPWRWPSFQESTTRNCL